MLLVTLVFIAPNPIFQLALARPVSTGVACTISEYNSKAILRVAFSVLTPIALANLLMSILKVATLILVLLN